MNVRFEMTQKERIMHHIESEYGSIPEYLWEKFPNHFIYRHKNNKKWFALIASITKDKLGEKEKGPIDIINIKLDPFEVDIYKSQNGFHPTYHMNKQKWLTAKHDDTIPDEIIEELIYNSFLITKK